MLGQWHLLQGGGRQSLALGPRQSLSLAAYPAVCRPAVCRAKGAVLRESQASPRIAAQQLWNTLNREEDSWGTPAWGTGPVPRNSVAEALSTQQCSGLSLAQCEALPST